MAILLSASPKMKQHLICPKVLIFVARSCLTMQTTGAICLHENIMKGKSHVVMILSFTLEADFSPFGYRITLKSECMSRVEVYRHRNQHNKNAFQYDAYRQMHSSRMRADRCLWWGDLSREGPVYGGVCPTPSPPP